MSRVLFDRNVPDPLHRYLTDHIVRTTDDEGWSMLENGDLIVAAEQAGFDVMVTGDKNLQYQQNLTGRRLSLIVLSNTAWPVVRPHAARIAAAVDQAQPGGFQELSFPRPTLRRRPFTQKS